MTPQLNAIRDGFVREYLSKKKDPVEGMTQSFNLAVAVLWPLVKLVKCEYEATGKAGGRLPCKNCEAFEKLGFKL